MSSYYSEGEVVKGPDVVGGSRYRPWVCVSGGTHPFDNEEGLWVVVSTTQRQEAIELQASDFTRGGLPKRSFANPWTITTIKYAEMDIVEGVLTDAVADEITKQGAAYLSPDSFSNRP
jgi:hypothetical protein